jgi:hypothetical protein
MNPHPNVTIRNIEADGDGDEEVEMRLYEAYNQEESPTSPSVAVDMDDMAEGGDEVGYSATRAAIAEDTGVRDSMDSRPSSLSNAQFSYTNSLFKSPSLHLASSRMSSGESKKHGSEHYRMRKSAYGEGGIFYRQSKSPSPSTPAADEEKENEKENENESSVGRVQMAPRGRDYRTLRADGGDEGVQYEVASISEAEEISTRIHDTSYTAVATMETTMNTTSITMGSRTEVHELGEDDTIDQSTVGDESATVSNVDRANEE